MKRFLGIAVLALAGTLSNGWGRPVSYPGGITTMLEVDGMSRSLLVHLTPSPHYAVGARTERLRKFNFWMHTAQMNNLLKRWNWPNAQANIYLKSGLGMAYQDEGVDKGAMSGAGFSGLATDWENRRLFVSYENRMIIAGKRGDIFTQAARAGIAPYIGGYGDLHTWVMVEAKHTPEARHPTTVTPLLRFFKGMHLVEVGVSHRGDGLFNWFVRF